MNLTLGRFRQIKEVLLERRSEEQATRLRVEEVKLQYLVGAIHAAAGNKRGVDAAQSIRLVAPRGKKAELPSTSDMNRMFAAPPEGVELPVASDKAAQAFGRYSK